MKRGFPGIRQLLPQTIVLRQEVRVIPQNHGDGQAGPDRTDGKGGFRGEREFAEIHMPSCLGPQGCEVVDVRLRA
jgi:hypothetical protein